MCRTGGRRCPSHSDPAAIALRNARRRAAYQASKGRRNSTVTEPVTTGTVKVNTETPYKETPAQQAFFKDTVARDANGELVKVYHGASVQFDSFDPATLGKGNDSWGNGFYFTSEKDTAAGYASESGSPDANVKEFNINLTNPILMDGKEHMGMGGYTFTAEQAANLLKRNPLAYIQPDEGDDEMNFLGDYSPEYWEKDHHTKEELDYMIDKVAAEYFTDTSWTNLETTFGRDHGAAWLEAVRAVTGHDGVIVDFGEAGKHYVAWFPDQMKLTSNTNPDHSDKF